MHVRRPTTRTSRSHLPIQSTQSDIFIKGKPFVGFDVCNSFDDYGAPQMLETYLYRHPLGMLEFCVDDGGIAGSGFKSSFRKLIRQHWVRVQDMVGQLHRGGVSGGGAQRDACAPDRSPGAQEAHRREEAHREGTRSRPPAIARNVR